MRSYIFIIIFGLLSVSGYSQSVNMQFKGFEKFRDTLSFTSIIPYNSNLHVINNTKVITVPANEVWVLDQSIMTLYEISHSYYHATAFIDSILTCNCISLDDHLLHSILNGNGENFKVEETSTFPSISYNPYIDYPYHPNWGYRIRFNSLDKKTASNSSSYSQNWYYSFDNMIKPNIVSDFFSDRIKLLPGVHRIKRNFMAYKFINYTNSSNIISSFIQHDILFEKYTMQ